MARPGHWGERIAETRNPEAMITTRCHTGMFFFVGMCMLVVFGNAQPGWALSWPMSSHGPDALFAVDKSKQVLLYFRKNNVSQQLDLVKKIPCATGKVNGDKFREGDMKTPEGIYFIQAKKEQGLNFGLYGDLAFVLNFPNPVDQAKGKTGHGIWLHGRGKPIRPHETRGCVALNNHDIKTFQSEVQIKTTPVVISHSISLDNDASAKENISETLIQATTKWARAWDDKSATFLSFYDPEFFPKRFFEHKQGLFKRYAWIDVLIDEIKCIEGQEYCVTYFNQLYKAPGFTSEGIKRLYWKLSDSGEWKIIGSEWFSSPTGLEDIYEHNIKDRIADWVTHWKAMWEQGNIAEYKNCYAKNAVQGNIRGRQAIAEHKKNLIAQGKKPSNIRMEDVAVRLKNDIVHVRFTQYYQAENGYADKGIKSLVLHRMDENDWRITSETWKRMDP
jgi:murein L,D-transpeptidase YafK